ncbi:MAG: CRISPR-associated helicase Cas3' [Anaeromyxobacteraceae bacterium]
MRGVPNDFWAKCRTGADGEPPAWHPLVDHCADVAACFEALLAQTTIRHRLARLAGMEELDERDRQRLAFLAALHDVGKFNLGFQARSRPGAPVTAGHVREVLSFLGATRYPESEPFSRALGLEELANWTPDLGYLVAALSHHGRLVAPDAADFFRGLWSKQGDLDPFKGVRRLADLARGWFPRAFDDGPPLPVAPAAQHVFSGLLTLADWIGSDESHFPFSERCGTDRMAFARGRAVAALAVIGLDPAGARSALGQGAPSFAQVSRHAPRPAQAELSKIGVPSQGSVVVLEAETGSGKTEAALLHFLRLFQAGAVDGMYFALPTRTAATQIHARVCAAVERAFPAPLTRPTTVLAVPGYLPAEAAPGTALRDPSELGPEERERSRHRSWASERPKRYMAGAVVVGTIDQVLLSALQVPHAHLRASALLRHLLVVDEVHASDAYMNRILEEVLRHHVDAGGHVLLMSATLGSIARERLVNPGARRRPTLAAAVLVPYPVVTVAVDRLGVESRPVEREGTRRIDIELRPQMDDPAAIARIALDAAARGARVLVLRNTVRGAVQTQEQLEAAAGGDSGWLFRCAGEPALHHARFAREDRALLDAAIQMRFGEGSPSGGCVAVATQTVQQSLDLDADLMVTDLCPMDVLLQRLGRLHRHHRTSRPDGFESPRAVVLAPKAAIGSFIIGKTGKASGPHGLGSVYSDLRIIEATRRLLEGVGHVETPTMSRELVERTTHPEAMDALVRECGGAWVQHAQAMKGSTLANTSQAGLNLVDWSLSISDRAVAFGAGDLAQQIKTRLGEGTRVARFERPLIGPFGAGISELNIPPWLARDAPEDASPMIEDACPGRIQFRFGSTRSLVYDRLGLRALKVEPR